jgi:hypothetical protein
MGLETANGAVSWSKEEYTKVTSESDSLEMYLWEKFTKGGVHVPFLWREHFLGPIAV